MAELPALSKREREIMDIVFARGSVTVSDLLSEMSDPPTRSALRSLLTILEDKGHLQHGKQGREFTYRPRSPARKRGGPLSAEPSTLSSRAPWARLWPLTSQILARATARKSFAQSQNSSSRSGKSTLVRPLPSAHRLLLHPSQNHESDAPEPFRLGRPEPAACDLHRAGHSALSRERIGAWDIRSTMVSLKPACAAVGYRLAGAPSDPYIDGTSESGRELDDSDD
ncbi:BlaI/MecI/CopY family transcriptional regulator [Verrucomicrobium spinosum]|uniref:BlaI/MecI/CopY family transcriptional regulator n=1 Tax=Verrucomicrobium spinosum TaxID=2736 RepID=UPI0009462EF1